MKKKNSRKSSKSKSQTKRKLQKSSQKDYLQMAVGKKIITSKNSTILIQ